MRKTIGIIASIVFVISASIDATTVSTIALIAWGAVVVASLSIAGLALRSES